MADNELLAAPMTRCPRCGGGFSCGADAGGKNCWCMELPPLPDADLTAAACYCPTCLRELLSAVTEA